MKQILIFLFSVLIISGCNNGKEQTQTENYKATGKAPDTILTVIGFPFNGNLRIDFATVLKKDTLDWLYEDSTTQKKKLRRGHYTFVQISLPDSVKGVDGITKAVLDSSGKQAFKNYTLQVPDSLIYFPRELDIRKIKKDHGLK